MCCPGTVIQVMCIQTGFGIQLPLSPNVVQELAGTVSGTEALVNIKLNAHRNKLMSVDLTMSGFSLINCELAGIILSCF